jgi:hypothetical protein
MDSAETASGGNVRKAAYLVFVAAFSFAFCLAVFAQQKSVQTGVGDGGSPHFRSEWDIHGAHITVEYGRPYLKGRTIGKDVVPYGEVWRTGADEATTITSTKPLKFGKITLAANTTYTINTLPNPDHWDLILGKLSKPGQWGIPYQPQLEIGRVPMLLERTTKPVEEETITIHPTSAGGTLTVEWGLISVSAPFTVE